MPINFRQMCGLQTIKREKPNNPKNPFIKQVLYYDGNIYNGWQINKKEIDDMNEQDIRRIIREELKELMDSLKNEASEHPPMCDWKKKIETDNGMSCRY